MQRSSVRSSRLMRIALGLCVAATVAASGAIGGAQANRAGASVTLKFASWDPHAITDSFITSCAKQLGINVVNTLVPYANYGTKIQTEMAAGTAPDLFYGLEDHTLAWGAAGDLLDQAPYFKQLKISTSDLLPQLLWWNHGKPGTQLVGISGAAEDIFLYYNKDTFAKAGLAAPPSEAAHAWTWSQFLAVAQKLTIDKNGKHPTDAGFDAHHITRYGVTVSDGWATLLPFVYSSGGAPFDSTNTHFTMNQPAAAAAVQMVADLTNKYHVAPTPALLGMSGSNLTLASGRVAMTVSGQWDVYFQQNPKKTYSMGIGVLPMLKTYKTLVFGGPLVVFAHTKYPLQTMQMLQCIHQQSLPLWQNGIWMPVTKSGFTPAALKTWAYTPAHPSNFVSVAVDTLKYAVGAPETETAQFNAAWVNVVQPALDQIFNTGNPAAQVLTSIKPRVDAILSQGA